MEAEIERGGDGETKKGRVKVEEGDKRVKESMEKW